MDYTRSEVAILIAIAATLVAGIGFPSSADLLALWLAGNFWTDGSVPELIYRGSDGLFTMRPPQPWIDTVVADGRETAVYPFIYPPLWAWVMSKVVAISTFKSFGLFMAAANLSMIVAMVVLVPRITPLAIPRRLYLLLAWPTAGLTLPFMLALDENQPQILVSFLILLGIERTARGAPIAGGAAMALAASLKLYPVLFAVFWLAGGERRAFTSFALLGGALGLLSIAVAGWPMHAAFLNEIRAISGSALYTLANFSFDPMIARHLYWDELNRFSTEETGLKIGWHVMLKTPAWRTFDVVLQMTVVLGVSWLAWRRGTRAPFFWPAAIIAVAVVSPLTWVYHLIPALVFLPALYGYVSPWGVVPLQVLLPFVLRSPYAYPSLGLTIIHPGGHEVAFLAVCALGALCLWVAALPSKRPLHPGPQSL